MINANIITEKDNVVVAIEHIEKGNEVEVHGIEDKFVCLDDVKIYHKIAREDIKKGEAVIKYGEHIGFALRDIKKGEHVHEHNTEGRREDLREKE